MDRFGDLKLNWSVGYNGSELHYITDDVLVYGCGNTLSFIKNDGRLFKSLQSEGDGVGVLTVCHKLGLVAYAEAVLKPKIFIINFPSCTVECIIEGGAKLEYAALSFSKNGKSLLTLSGVPDFKMTLWDCTEHRGHEISTASVGEGGIEVSFNPLNSKQFLLLGPSMITLWNLESCGSEILLSPIEVELPERKMEVGTVTTPKVPPPSLALTKGATETQLKTVGTGSGVGHFMPPNLSEIYYKDSYETFIRMKEAVEPKSFCWSSKQSIYVGCVGGQLIVVDVDIGSTTMLVNPLPAIEKNESIESVKTAHSTFKENSIDCMALSRRGLFVAGKDGLLQCFNVNTLELLDEVDVSKPIRHLFWSPCYSKLALSTETCTILTTNPLKLSLDLVSDNCHSELIGLDVLHPGLEYCVTCRREGDVQVWRIADGTLESTIKLDNECTSICCPMTSTVAVVGTSSGHLYFLSFLDLGSPYLIHRKLMHSGPVTAVKHDQAGFFLVSISTEGPVFFYDNRPSSGFAVLGYIDLPGNILDVSLLLVGEKASRTQAAILTDSEKDPRIISYFTLETSVLDKTPPEFYTDQSKQISHEFIKLRSVETTEQISRITLVPNNRVLSLLDSTGELIRFCFPLADQEQELNLDSRHPSHDLHGGKVVISFHQKWSATVAQDGKLSLRVIDNPNGVLSCLPHHHQSDGCHDVIFTKDSKSLITIGDHGTITCWKIDFSEYGDVRAVIAAGYYDNAMKSMSIWMSKEIEYLMDMPPFTIKDREVEKTWLKLAQEEAHKEEDKKYSDIKAALREDISALRYKILEMINSNEELPEIEKLERQEFLLDTDDHQRMLTEEERLIEEVREEIELSNLAAMFMRDWIKTQCWDKMVVKGKLVKAFQCRLEVSNYPMISRTEAKLKELERIKNFRKMELIERKIRHELSEELLKRTSSQSVVTSADDDDDDYIGDKYAQTQKEEEEGDPDALLGSHRSHYKGDSELLANQFELHSAVYKRHQIVLLEDSIYRIKEHFNKEFDEVVRLKVNEIARIKEKNIRISKIISQLKLDDSLVQPSLEIEEEPEKLLVVEDDEVKVEKYISPEEKKRQEELARIEEEARLAAMGDNPRERALDMMMGGRLEANVEEDLFKDLSKPEELCKDPTEMTEDEIRMAREFEKKEKAFLEEREKLKKALEAELRKLQSSITQGMEQFDERLQKLFQFKIKTQAVVHQEEMMIFHLIRSLLVEKEITMREKELNLILNKKKIVKVQLGTVISNAKMRLEEVRELYESLAAEDKEMDKSFKKDFADCEPNVDALYKLFRKRPRGIRHRAVESIESGLVGDPKSQNPFAQRPTSAGGIKKDGENPMSELDQPVHMPEGLDLPAWERFIAHRHRKVEAESKVKTVALELADINAFLQKRNNEDERLQREIQNAFKELSKLQEDRLVFDLNLEIQFLLKQGQVEEDSGDFIPDYSKSVLVHRSHIEDLNGQIMTLGETKLNSILECKDYKRGICMLEWEKQKMEMDIEDLLDKGRSIQMMRVTKDLLQRLHESDLFHKDTKEKDTLDKTMEFNTSMYCKQLNDKSKILKDLSRQVKIKNAENKELDHQLRELQVSVAERAQIEALAGVPPSVTNREQLMQEIVTRRKLVDTIKAQDEEYSILKAEMERLRMKTFPALVQVD